MNKECCGNCKNVDYELGEGGSIAVSYCKLTGKDVDIYQLCPKHEFMRLPESTL